MYSYANAIWTSCQQQNHASHEWHSYAHFFTVMVTLAVWPKVKQANGNFLVIYFAAICKRFVTIEHSQFSLLVFCNHWVHWQHHHKTGQCPVPEFSLSPRAPILFLLLLIKLFATLLAFPFLNCNINWKHIHFHYHVHQFDSNCMQTCIKLKTSRCFIV